MSKVTKGISRVLSADAVASLFGKPLSHAMEYSREFGVTKVAGRFVRMLSGADDAPLPVRIADPRERFEAVAAQQGLTTERLRERLKDTTSAFWTYWGLEVVWIAVVVASLRYAGDAPHGPVWAVAIQYQIAKWGMAVVFPLLAFKHGITNWQIRHRSLRGWREYVASRDILPTSEF